MAHDASSPSCWVVSRAAVLFAPPPSAPTDAPPPTSASAPAENVNDPTVDDYVLLDIPAALDYIRKTTGFSQVHWVGHSMGGMLLYAYDALFDGGAVASGITLGSPIGFQNVKFHRPMEFSPATMHPAPSRIRWPCS